MNLLQNIFLWALISVIALFIAVVGLSLKRIKLELPFTTIIFLFEILALSWCFFHNLLLACQNLWLGLLEALFFWLL
jgi:hypothetical protein